ncbi:iron ABC transporter permease [Gordonia malaquae]|uniref:FecCD family ABC transporter permease n=1 Tax=Gordonia malaquae TaxID=410332 RepID=UPI0030FE016A
MTVDVEAGTSSTDGRTAVAARVADMRRRSRRRTGVVACTLVAITLGVFWATMTVGEPDIETNRILQAMIGRGRGLANFVIFEDRLPRALVAILAGGLLAVSGTMYQQVIRNPLATPDILGVSAGAAAGAAVSMVLIPGSALGVSGSALVGALIVFAILSTTVLGTDGSTYRLILVGIGVSGLAASITAYALMQARGASLLAARRWTSGSTNSSTWSDVEMLGGLALAVAVAVIVLARGLGALRYGDDVAVGLGAHAARTRIGALLVGAVSVALTTSIVGPIGFIALVSGPIAQRLAPRGPQLGLSVLVGASLVLTSDLIAQYAPGLSPLPVGIISSLVGAPILVALLLGGRRASS